MGPLNSAELPCWNPRGLLALCSDSGQTLSFGPLIHFLIFSELTSNFQSDLISGANSRSDFSVFFCIFLGFFPDVFLFFFRNSEIIQKQFRKISEKP